MSYWIACYCDVGAERKVRDEVQLRERGAFIPTFVKVFLQGGRRRSYERSLLNRYVFVALHDERDDIWGGFNDIDGVHRVIANSGRASHVTDGEMVRITLPHASGEYNVVQARQANGRFGNSTQSTARKQKKRRRRPRAGKTYRNPTVSHTGAKGVSHAA